MIATSPPIMNVLAEALRPGPALAPSTLLVALEQEAFPIDAIVSAYGAGVITEAIEQDFAFLRLLKMQPGDSGPTKRWASMIRWLLLTAKSWKRSEDTQLRELTVLLLTSRLCGGDADLWLLLSGDQTPSAEFLSTLRVLIASTQIEYSSRTAEAAPIWESEFVEIFRDADAAGDWAEIASMWPRLADANKFNILFVEMVSCLARFSFVELVCATDKFQQCPPVMEIARRLSVDQRLRLAMESGSERVRFCCVFTALNRGREAIPLSLEDETTLSELLTKIAASPEEWRKWMAAFNTYPVRYPMFHRPLGRALARASHEAVAAYINSIRVYPIRYVDVDESRILVGDCLRVFSQEAPSQHRQEAWAHAYERWLDWRFGAALPETHLFDIARSSLDFAVVCYAHECMSTAERESALAEIRKQLSEVELTWFGTKTDCTTEWYRLLSLFQPYADACKIAETGDSTVFGSSLYYPLDVSKSLYHQIMF